MQDTTNTRWLDLTTSIFLCVADNYGEPATYREILFSHFGRPHDWFIPKYGDPNEKWISGESNDLETMIDIRNGVTDEKKVLLKQTLQCYTVSANFKCKKKAAPELLHYNPILQLDFDKLQDYDISEVRAAIFDIPFVGFCGLSVSGKGLFALILISEPEKLNEYAEHCFAVFNHYGLPPDTTKGRNYSDLRFVSYDANGLYREDPQPLKIKKFHTVKKPQPTKQQTTITLPEDALIRWAIKQVQQAEPGRRFETVRKTSYTLGGFGTGLDEIKHAINNSPQYVGVEGKYLTHAVEGFAAGQNKTLSR